MKHLIGRLWTFHTQCDLTTLTLDEAIAFYRQERDVDPVWLGVGANLTSQAYEAVNDSTMPRLIVVILPALSLDAWIVAGADGLIYSDGA